MDATESTTPSNDAVEACNDAQPADESSALLQPAEPTPPPPPPPSDDQQPAEPKPQDEEQQRLLDDGSGDGHVTAEPNNESGDAATLNGTATEVAADGAEAEADDSLHEAGDRASKGMLATAVFRTPARPSESHENPFVSGGELSQKADYILSHSTISRSQIRISDPDLSKSRLVEEEAVQPVDAAKAASEAGPRQRENGKVDDDPAAAAPGGDKKAKKKRACCVVQ